MQEELISFETAKLAKEKGFDIPVGQYISDIRGYSGYMGNMQDFNKEDIGGLKSAPTQSLLQKWLREIHRIWVEIYMNNDIPSKGESYSYLVLTKNGGVVVHNIGGGNFTTYEESLEFGLQEALKLIK